MVKSISYTQNVNNHFVPMTDDADHKTCFLSGTGSGEPKGVRRWNSMRPDHNTRKRITRVLILALVAVILLPFAAQAQQAEEQKIVRVGWFDSSFCYWDEFGRRCGIDYQYQQKISAYTGWTYEYIEDSWPNLLQKLMSGEIDLLSDVSYKAERTEFISYPDLPMGTETYYIYISGDNREITADNLRSFNGKKIGVNQGSVQEGFLRDWAEKNGLNIEIVPMSTDEDESMDMVMKGTLDGYASIYSFSSKQKVTPVSRIGGSDYYYAVNKNRPDLLAELNMALAGIHDEDPYFNERLSEERLYDTRTNASLTPTQEDWIKTHGTIRVGYPENFLPFCQKDEATGELTGALKDFLTHAENSLGNIKVHFSATPYASVSAALRAMENGEVDCVFPVNLNYYDADTSGVRLTNPAMKTGVNAVIRDTENHDLSRESTIVIAAAEGNPNVDTFIKEYYPACRMLVYPDENRCYQAVADGTAGCTLISNYRVPDAEEALNRYKLFSVPTGEHIPFSFAVKKADRDLYFLLNKMVLTTQSGDMDSALASYMHTSQKVSLSQFLKDNLVAVIGFLLLVFAVILFLMMQRLKAQRKANAQQILLDEAAEVAELKQTITYLLDNMPGMTFTKDAETGVYLACNQAFAEYANRKKPEEVTGHTDAELFDAETARRLVVDDKMALSMDGPYIFFEDATDDEGNRRQVKMTKLKYTDDNGRLCVLGMSQDATDSYRIRRGSVTNKEGYEKARNAGIIYTHIAQALAQGYADLYYVDMNTEQFIEYRSTGEGASLAEVRRGWHFFEECQDQADELVHPDDRAAVKAALDRKALTAVLDRDNSFFTTVRRLGEDGPKYISMRVTRIQDDDRYIVLGITDIDSQVRARSAAVRVSEEQTAYSRLSALAGDYLCIYIVVPETGRYREFSATAGYRASFALAKEGQDFFNSTRESARQFNHPDDLNRFLSVFTKENILADIERHGLFTVSYRLMMDGRPRYVRLKAVMVEEKEGRRLIVGINDIDAQVRQEEHYVEHLAQARIEANVDALTGVKNRHAYLEAEERLNNQIAEDPKKEFAVVILDVNDLKVINDREGHKAGDQYLRDACRIICKVFKHSPVFRIGGDEFAVISQGEDYEQIDALVQAMHDRNEEALNGGGIVIACGMARHGEEPTVAPVFERADQRMYDNKTELKNREKDK